MNYREMLQAMRGGPTFMPTEIERARRAAGVDVVQMITDLTKAFSGRERCPECDRATPIRTSRLVEGGTKRRRYYECECGAKWSRTFEEK